MVTTFRNFNNPRKIIAGNDSSDVILGGFIKKTLI
jgi:hypothetical protein